MTPMQDDEFQQPHRLQAALGSFWNEVYEGKTQVTDLLTARLLAARDTWSALQQLHSTLGRRTIAIFRRPYLAPLYFRRSAARQTQAIAKYDGTWRYDGTLRYDQPAPNAKYSLPRPPGLVDVAILINRFTDPSLVWIRDLDFSVTDDAIVFHVDPFADPRVPQQPVYDDRGQAYDQEAVLWMVGAVYDDDVLYQQYGYVIRARLPSSEEAKAFVNLVYDAFVGGTSELTIRRLFALALGAPLVESDGEVVEYVFRDGQGLAVVTDRRVYRFAATATPAVKVGDMVRQGDSLVRELRFTNFRPGSVPDWLPGLGLGPEWLDPCYQSDLLFRNQSVPLQVDTRHPSGFTRVMFPVSGHPETVRQFFEDLHAHGVAAATRVEVCPEDDLSRLIQYPQNDGTTVYRRPGTLAHFLDQRQEKIGEPGPESLPKTINPLQWLLSVIGANVFGVYCDLAGYGPRALGLDILAWLPRLVPPQTVVLYLMMLTPPREDVTLELPDVLASAIVPETVTEYLTSAEFVDSRRMARAVDTPH